MAIHVVRPGEGEMSGGGPIRARIIEDGSHTGHRLGLIEATVPAGRPSPGPARCKPGHRSRRLQPSTRTRSNRRWPMAPRS